MRAILFVFLLFHFNQVLNSQTDTTSLLPSKMSILEKGLWGERGLFRITGLAPLTLQARQSELKLRRTMLSIHQLGGFATLGLMAISAYYGKKAYDLVPGYAEKHRTLVRATIASYSLTALLALMSPPPLIKRDDKWSSLAIHKTLAWIHGAGMVATAILGRQVRESANLEEYNRLKKIHMGVAIATFTALASSMIVITFR
ncbi:hypothetical protein JGI1_00097 [Candidatus Thermokryptus mobilis]|uniref:Cytochrome b561 n=2 Tax=Candidatus Thermokryptus mobilis TaxID=1643428 RepID=A0A0S4MS70_9BACT|nr:hypothetical protein JGI1_00097 [Candidatus Thermokryptus mobilis]